MHGSSERKKSGYVAFMENEAEGVSVRQETGKPLCTLSYLESCAECKQNFHNREPVLLPCLHSLCKTCVPLPWRSLVIPDQPGSSPADQVNVLRCPVCRQECMDVDVMENFFVRDSVEIPSSTVDKPVQLCMSCDDKTMVSGFCEECVEFLCVTCIDAHQRVKFTKDHHIRQQEELSQILKISTPKPVFCDLHKQEPLKLFCETCDHPTCRDCQLLKHKDHNYQFLEDAYKYHRKNMEDMVCQLQEKRRGIEGISNLINNGLAQANDNYTTVQNEIKSSMCSLISEINKKGKMLLNQLETLTKDHHDCLRKQQQDVNSLSRHLDHVITFTKWATGCNGGTALLQCKRLILFQIRNLLRTKCSMAFVPQTIVHFQCKSGYWASNVEIGSLVVENIPGPQTNGFQGLCSMNHLGQCSPASLPPGPSQQPLPSPSTLAQLQIQVERLAQQQPPPLAPPPHWSWCQSVPLPRAPYIRPQRSSEMPQGFYPVPQQSRGFTPPHYNQFRPSGIMDSPGSPSQALQNLKGLVISPGCPPKHAMDAVQTQSTLLYSHSAPLASNDQLSSPLSLQQRNTLAFSSPLLRPTFPQTTFIPGGGAPASQNNCQSPCAHPDTETKVPVGTQAFSSAAKRRRQSSPGPVIIIKDEPEEMDRMRYCTLRPNLPDSTGDQGQTPQDGVHKDGSHHSTGVQTVVSQHKTTDWPLVAQHRTKEETLLVPQQGKTNQSSVPFQNTEKNTLTAQKGTKGQCPQYTVADDQTIEDSSSSGPSSDVYSKDETQSPRQSPEGLKSKGHDQRANNPESSQPPLVKYVTEKKAEAIEEPSQDRCSVCHTGGELLCCDKCTKMYHSSCHIPHLLKPPCGQWFCSLCRDLYKPEMEYDSEILTETTLKTEVSAMMKPVDKRKCQRLLLQIYCSELSTDLRMLLPHTFENQQCDSNEKPVQLAEVKSKLESQQRSCHCSPFEFASDVRSIFRNYVNVYETDSNVRTAAANLEKFFEEQLTSMFPEITFS